MKNSFIYTLLENPTNVTHNSPPPSLQRPKIEYGNKKDKKVRCKCW